jgi:polysaccharide export outer membrane protein
LVNPHVSVMMETYRSRNVSVTGAVVKGGTVELPGEEKITLIEAIARAGGRTSKASDKIEYFHRGKSYEFKYKDLVNREPGKQIYVQTGDVINIPESLF